MKIIAQRWGYIASLQQRYYIVSRSNFTCPTLYRRLYDVIFVLCLPLEACTFVFFIALLPTRKNVSCLSYQIDFISTHKRHEKININHGLCRKNQTISYKWAQLALVSIQLSLIWIDYRTFYQGHTSHEAYIHNVLWKPCITCTVPFITPPVELSNLIGPQLWW